MSEHNKENARFYKQLIINDNIIIKDDQSILENESARDFEDRTLASHIQDSDKKLEPISSFSDKEKERLDKIIETKAETKGDGIYTIPLDEVARAIDVILSEQTQKILPAFYNDINQENEFGVSRFVSDRMAYLSRLLQNTKLEHIQDTSYLVSAEHKDSYGNSIKLEHRFKATNHEEAHDLYEKISSQLAGIQLKAWLACWRLANQLRRFTFSCNLTDIMTIANPERNGYFSVNEKIEFFEHIKSLEQTKILFSTRERTTKKRKKILQTTFEIPLLEIHARKGGEEDKYPQQITISIMKLDPNLGKMAFVGTPFKNKTLELHADDTSLATWLQTRKSQRRDEQFISIELDFLFKLAGLGKTAQSNRAQAKKMLFKKLQRLHEKGIIPTVPDKLEEMTHLTIR